MDDRRHADQTLRTIVITGADSGLGLRTAEALVSRGGRVIMACRNPTKAAAALEVVQSAAKDARAELVSPELVSLHSVRQCVCEIAANANAVDTLIDNAGVQKSLPDRAHHVSYG